MPFLSGTPLQTNSMVSEIIVQSTLTATISSGAK
jgi:hypothetical protein